MCTSSNPQSRICAMMLLRAGAVGVGQVGDGELAFLGVARVAVLLRLPASPRPVAQRGRDAELVVQADLHDAVDVAQALLQFEVGGCAAGAQRCR
jgi:hypothetical protein